KLRARLDGTKKVVAGKDDPDEGADDLIQVNIEGVDCRYVDDLAAFWETFKAREKGDPFKDSIKNTIRPVSQRDTPPGEKEKGWVVELRGFTLHKKKVGFVIASLVENIARVGIDEPPPAPAEGAPANPAAPQPPADADKTKKKNEGPVKNL